MPLRSLSVKAPDDTCIYWIQRKGANSATADMKSYPERADEIPAKTSKFSHTRHDLVGNSCGNDFY